MKAGDFLIATPTIIGDYNFQRSGILMVDCKTTGSIGFIINKKLEYTLDDLMENVSSPFPMYYGGPVKKTICFLSISWAIRSLIVFILKETCIGVEILSPY